MQTRIVIFAIPKAFSHHTGVIQSNALESWSRLPQTEVVVFGTDAGVAEAADRIGAIHIPDIATNEFGTPLISDAFAQMKGGWPDHIRIYVNSDIVLTASLVDAVTTLEQTSRTPWMIVGRRVDCDVTDRLDFSEGWQRRVEAMAGSGVMHGPSGMDYFVCSRDMPVILPEMAVGRPGWDSWFVFQALLQRVAVVDGTRAVVALHQNHAPAYSSTGTEARRNVQAAGGLFNVATIRQANYRLARTGGVKINYWGRLLFSAPARWAMGLLRLSRARRAG